MPEPTVPMSFDFSDAPDGGLSLDDIFIPSDSAAPNPNTTQVVTQPQESQDTETFLKTSTGTVYKTADEAVKGIEHKDALISELRQKLSETNGVDPLRKRTPEVETPGAINYVENPKKYFEDLNEAAAQKGPDTEARIMAVQAKFVRDNLAPYAGILSNAVKAQAVEQVSSTIPEFNKFLGSEDYSKTLEQYPLLKSSIAISEAHPERSGDLGQLYRMAYEVSNGRNLPKIVEAQRTQIAPPQTRPTVSSTPQTPPVERATQPTLNTSAGRKSLIADQEARGIDNLRF